MENENLSEEEEEVRKMVKFKHKMGIYAVGERASFKAEVADRIIDEGLAELVRVGRPKMENAKDKQARPQSRDKKYVTK